MTGEFTIPQPKSSSGWSTGFSSMFAKENAAWWRPKRSLVLAGIMVLIINGFLAFLLFVDSASASLVIQSRQRYTVSNFFLTCGLVTALLAVLTATSSIINEKQSGTVAWVLSKPLSRIAFVLSKIAAHSIGFLVVGFVLQGLIAYIQFSLVPGMAPRADLFVLGLGIGFVHLMFYLTLSMMLGTLCDSSVVANGIPIALMFAQIFILQQLSWAKEVFPTMLIGNTVTTVVLGQAQPSLMPILVTGSLAIVFAGTALWYFGRVEL